MKLTTRQVIDKIGEYCCDKTVGVLAERKG